MFSRAMAFVTGGYGSDRTGVTVVRNSVGSVVVRAVAAVLVLVMNAVLARVAGPEHYGGFVFVMAWLNVLLIPVCLGFDKLLIRDAAIYGGQSDSSRLAGTFRTAQRWVILFSALVALLLVLAVAVTQRGAPLDTRLGLYLAGILLPIAALIRLRQGVLQGLDAIGPSQIPEFAAQPLLLILLALALHAWTSQLLAVSALMALNLVAGLLSLGLAALFLARRLHVGRAERPQGAGASRVLLSGLPFMLGSGVFVLNDQLPPLMLGALGTARQVAVFAAAEKWSIVTVFVLQALGLALAPIFADLHARGERDDLQRLFTRSTQVITAAALLPLILFVAAPGFFLAAFGPGFQLGAGVLIVLAVAQFLNAATGLVGILLIMTGHERGQLAGVAVGAVVNVVGCLIGIRVWGVTGAAVAAAASVVVSNVLLCGIAYRSLGIYPTAIGLWLARQHRTSTGKPALRGKG